MRKYDPQNDEVSTVAEFETVEWRGSTTHPLGKLQDITYDADTQRFYVTVSKRWVGEKVGPGNLLGCIERGTFFGSAQHMHGLLPVASFHLCCGRDSGHQNVIVASFSDLQFATFL